MRLLDFTSGVHQIPQAWVLEERCSVLRGRFHLPRRLPRRPHSGGVGELARFFNICSEFGGVGTHESRKAEEDRFLQ